MKCKKCGKECLENELIDGFCSDCLKKYKNNPEELKTVENKIAKLYKIVSVIVLILGLTASLIMFTSEDGLSDGIEIIIITLSSCLFLIGFAETIQLLENIKNK